MLLIGLVVALIIAVGAIIWFWRQRSIDPSSSTTRSTRDEPQNSTPAPGGTPFHTDAILDAINESYRLAFGVARIDYRILGEHQRVLTLTREAIPAAMGQPRYFPRKPALLPKLLRAINSSEMGRNEIVRLILQDATLAGSVLKRANSVYYRSGHDVVESIDRAVTILGNEGLRAPVASAVMQPVFQLPGGFFENFAPITWEQARRTAIAAEEFARVHKSADEFVAHLAGMLGSLSRIVLFRLTMDKYRQKGNIMPRPEVFIQLMIEHGAQVTRDIAAAWEMSPAFLEALDSQIKKTAPEQMTPLAKTVYYANLCGTLATLHQHEKIDAETAQALLLAQGLAKESFARVWEAASQPEIS